MANLTFNASRVFLGTSLLDCLIDGDLRNLKILVEEKGADPNVILPEGYSPLHYVAGMENQDFALNAAELFLKHGGDPNIICDDGTTPVHVSAIWGHVPMLQLLLKHGGDPWREDASGLNAFSHAERKDQTSAVQVLKEHAVQDIIKSDRRSERNHPMTPRLSRIAEETVMLTDSSPAENQVSAPASSRTSGNDKDSVLQLPMTWLSDTQWLSDGTMSTEPKSSMSRSLSNGDEFSSKLSSTDSQMISGICPLSTECSSYTNSSKSSFSSGSSSVTGSFHKQTKDPKERKGMRSLIEKFSANKENFENMSTKCANLLGGSGMVIGKKVSFSHERSLNLKNVCSGIFVSRVSEDLGNISAMTEKDINVSKELSSTLDSSDVNFSTDFKPLSYSTNISDCDDDSIAQSQSIVFRNLLSADGKDLSDTSSDVPQSHNTFKNLLCAGDKYFSHTSSNTPQSHNICFKNCSFATGKNLFGASDKYFSDSSSTPQSHNIVFENCTFATGKYFTKTPSNTISRELLSVEGKHFSGTTSVSCVSDEVAVKKCEVSSSVCVSEEERRKGELTVKETIDHGGDFSDTSSAAPQPHNTFQTLLCASDKYSSDPSSNSSISHNIVFKNHSFASGKYFSETPSNTVSRELPLTDDENLSRTTSGSCVSDYITSTKCGDSPEVIVISPSVCESERESTKGGLNVSKAIDLEGENSKIKECSRNEGTETIDLEGEDSVIEVCSTNERTPMLIPTIKVIHPSDSFDEDVSEPVEVAGIVDISHTEPTEEEKQKCVEEWLASQLSSGMESVSLEDYYTCDDDGEDDPLNTAAMGSALCIDERDSLGSGRTIATVSECVRHTDEEYGISLLEERFLVNPVGSSGESESESGRRGGYGTGSETCDTDAVRQQLLLRGRLPGPVTSTTKRVYRKQLQGNIVTTPSRNQSPFCQEIVRSLNPATHLFFLPHGEALERKIRAEFSPTKNQVAWREGSAKTSFNYLLLDPRITLNLPCRVATLSPVDTWSCFLKSIFYIGKGKRSRPYSHLYEAVDEWRKVQKGVCSYKQNISKLKKILDIWRGGKGVVCLHIFQNIIPVEAYTREAAMIDALGLSNLCNQRRSEYYGEASKWFSRDQRIFGIFLLHKAMQMFVLEGERQLRPSDVGK